MFVVSRYWTTTGNGQTVTEVPRDNKAAIMDSIASSYALQRPRFGATTPPKPAKSEGKSGGWPYYQRYKQAEAQKAQIFEDIQRKMANATSGNSIGGVHSWNSTDIAGQRQHRLRMKHHRLTSKGKRLRTRKWGEGGKPLWHPCTHLASLSPRKTPFLPIVEKRGDIVHADNEGPTVDAIFSFVEINGETEQRGDIFPRKWSKDVSSSSCLSDLFPPFRGNRLLLARDHVDYPFYSSFSFRFVSFPSLWINIVCRSISFFSFLLSFFVFLLFVDHSPVWSTSFFVPFFYL